MLGSFFVTLCSGRSSRSSCSTLIIYRASYSLDWADGLSDFSTYRLYLYHFSFTFLYSQLTLPLLILKHSKLYAFSKRHGCHSLELSPRPLADRSAVATTRRHPPPWLGIREVEISKMGRRRMQVVRVPVMLWLGSELTRRCNSGSWSLAGGARPLA